MDIRRDDMILLGLAAAKGGLGMMLDCCEY